MAQRRKNLDAEFRLYLKPFMEKVREESKGKSNADVVRTLKETLKRAKVQIIASDDQRLAEWRDNDIKFAAEQVAAWAQRLKELMPDATTPELILGLAYATTGKLASIDLERAMGKRRAKKFMKAGEHLGPEFWKRQ